MSDTKVTPEQEPNLIIEKTLSKEQLKVLYQ
jgi:hypothetical protein